MADLGEKFLRAFIPIFVAVDPIGLAAIFLTLGLGVPPEQRKRIAAQAALATLLPLGTLRGLLLFGLATGLVGSALQIGIVVLGRRTERRGAS